MIVSISGFGNTGASAVVDYLKSYDELRLLDSFEFQLLHQPDGINDLKYHLVRNKERITCNVAISRFVRLCKKSNTGQNLKHILGDRFTKWYRGYVNELSLVTWKGENSSFDPIDISHRAYGFFGRMFIILDKMAKKINKHFHIFPYRKKFFSFLSEDEFDSITKKHLKALLEMLGVDDKRITVIDMLFSATNPLQGIEFFDAAKSLLVVRDPRDVYVTAKLHIDDCRFMPNNDVEGFIAYYRTLMNTINSHNDKNLLVISYEDLIYDYFNVTERIKSFLEVDTQPKKEFVYFNPLYSVKFTNRQSLYKNYERDVEMIKKQLDPFLYNFASKQAPKNNALLCEKVNNKQYKGLVQK